jgi:choline dehydrogenase
MSVVPAYCSQYGATDPATANSWPLVDWGFVTQPEQGLGGRELHYARGKTWGGR